MDVKLLSAGNINRQLMVCLDFEEQSCRVPKGRGWGAGGGGGGVQQHSEESQPDSVMARGSRGWTAGR